MGEYTEGLIMMCVFTTYCCLYISLSTVESIIPPRHSIPLWISSLVPILSCITWICKGWHFLYHMLSKLFSDGSKISHSPFYVFYLSNQRIQCIGPLVLCLSSNLSSCFVDWCPTSKFGWIFNKVWILATWFNIEHSVLVQRCVHHFVLFWILSCLVIMTSRGPLDAFCHIQGFVVCNRLVIGLIICFRYATKCTNEVYWSCNATNDCHCLIILVQQH